MSKKKHASKKKASRKKSQKKHNHKKETKHDSVPTPSRKTPSRKKDSSALTWVLAILVVLALGYIIYDNVTGADMPALNTTADVDPIIIDEYSDFECPFCSRAVPVIDQIKAQYGDLVEIRFHHFALNFHPNAQKAAEASECARDQGKFWEYHDILYANQNALSVSALKSYAVQLGLDAQAFNQCLDSGEKSDIVMQDLQEGRQRGVSGTPTFFIGDEKIVGAQRFEVFEQAINAELAAQGSDAPESTTPEDPEVGLTVIDDPSCTVCNTSRIVDVIQTQLFPSVVVTEYDASEAEAQELIEELELTALPAFIFDEEIAETQNFDQIAQVLEVKEGGRYTIMPVALGTVKLINPPETEGRPALGQEDAPITMVLYDDFECPFCKTFEDETFPQLKENYVETGQVKIVFKHFPLGFHQHAKPAAEASECAFEQDMFWEYKDLLFERQENLSEADYVAWAGEIGLDEAAFEECLESDRFVPVVENDLTEGQADGISGTPGFIIDGVVVTGALPYEVFDQFLTEMLS
ncbi:MAG: DsbA family protein [Nanoarchaeota archaeon]